jgi:hypothetical protein
VRWSDKRPEGTYHESNWQGFFVRIAGTTDRLFECHANSNDDSEVGRNVQVTTKQKKMKCSPSNVEGKEDRKET